MLHMEKDPPKQEKGESNVPARAVVPTCTIFFLSVHAHADPSAQVRCALARVAYSYFRATTAFILDARQAG